MTLKIATAIATLLIGAAGIVVTVRYPVNPPVIARVLMLIPAGAALVFAFASVTFADVINWIVSNPGGAIGLLFVGAALPVVLGMLVDAPIAYWTYRRRHKPDRRLTFADYRCISKYGHVNQIIDGAGRFDYDVSHIFYSAGCNLSSAVCLMALIMFAASIPGLDSFVVEHSAWFDYISMFSGLAMLMKLVHSHRQQTGVRPANVNDVAENPDNALLSRAHSVANVIYVVLALTILVALLSAIVAYGYASGGGLHLSWAFPCFLLTSLAYLWFQGDSELARFYNSKSRGLWMNSHAYIVIGALVIAMGPFRFSSATIGTIAVCMVAAFFASRKKVTLADAVTAFPILVTLVIFASIGVYFAT